MNLSVTGKYATEALEWAGVKDVVVLDIEDDRQVLSVPTDEGTAEQLIQALVLIYTMYRAGVKAPRSRKTVKNVETDRV